MDLRQMGIWLAQHLNIASKLLYTADKKDTESTDQNTTY